MGLRIFYLGKFELPHRTENYVSSAFTSLGCIVHKRQITMTMTYPGVLRQIEAFNPDIVMFSKSNVAWYEELIAWCKANGILTTCWLFDLMWDIPRSVAYKDLPQYKVDVLFTTDGGHIEQWKKAGANHITLRQGIHLPEAVLFPSENPRYDVGFVGTDYKHGNRHILIRWLRAYYQDKFKHYTNTRGLDLNRALANTKIIIGDSYPSPNYWSNRIYEIIGRGGLLFHPVTEGLNEVIPREHYVAYNRIKSKRDFLLLSKKIQHYLKNPERREYVRTTGFNYVRSKYTYTHRCVELLRYIHTHLAMLNGGSPSAGYGYVAPATSLPLGGHV